MMVIMLTSETENRRVEKINCQAYRLAGFRIETTATMVEQTAAIAAVAGHPSMATSRWVFWMRIGSARTMERGRFSMGSTSFDLECETIVP